MIKFLIRPVNAFIAGYGYLQSSLTGRVKVYGMPLAAGVELTNNCNLKCPECYSGSGLMMRERGYMDIVLFEKILSDLQPYIYNLNLYFQGEPMLHPKFFTFLKKAKNLHTTVATNGHFLSGENAVNLVKSGLGRLIVSLDGMDRAAYNAYRINGDLEKVLDGIKNVSEAKKIYSSSLKLVIQFLVNSHNERQIPLVKDFSRKMNAELKLKSMQVLNSQESELWMPSINKYRRYKKKEEKYILKSSFPDRCARLWFNPVITWDGKVLPCCFDKDAAHIMGDIKEDSFREIWEGPKFRIFRKSILNGRLSTDICKNCTSGLKGVKI